MFFYAGKILWALLSPLTLIGLLLLTGAALRAAEKQVWSRRLMTSGVALFLGLGFLPVGTNLIVFLERQHPMAEKLPEQVQGIIVLGGAVESGMSEKRGQPSINDYGERITEAVRLSRIYPQARLVYAGGSGGMNPTSSTESEETKKLLENMGISTERIVFENESRTTYENMTQTRSLIAPQAGDTWLLVTSAFHLPRSVGVFEKGGWHVVPYPAGYLEEGRYLYVPTLDLLGNFYKLQVATKEIVGIIAYTLSGKL